MTENKKKKDFYTTQELVDAEWFPIRSTLTVKKLIENGTLKAVDISTSKNFKRYRISKESAKQFIEMEKIKE